MIGFLFYSQLFYIQLTKASISASGAPPPLRCQREGSVMGPPSLAPDPPAAATPPLAGPGQAVPPGSRVKARDSLTTGKTTANQELETRQTPMEQCVVYPLVTMLFIAVRQPINIYTSKPRVLPQVYPLRVISGPA